MCTETINGTKPKTPTTSALIKHTLEKYSQKRR